MSAFAFLASLNAFLRCRFGQGAAAQENQVLGLFAPHTKFTAWPTTLRPAPLFVPSPPPFAMIPTLEPPVHLMGPSPYLEKKVAEPPVHPQTSVLPVQVMPNDNDWIIPFPYVPSSYPKIALCQSKYLESWRLLDTWCSTAAMVNAELGCRRSRLGYSPSLSLDELT